MKQVSINTYKNIFSKKGFFIEKNFFDKFTIKKILREIQSAKGMVKYYDKKISLKLPLEPINISDRDKNHPDL